MNRKLGKLLPTLLLVFLSLSLYSQVPKDVSLDGVWNFIADQNQSGLHKDFPKGLPKEAKKVTVPHTWNIMSDLENYSGLAWYQKNIVPGQDWKGRKVYLKFGAVYHDAVVYVNGEKVGEHLNSGYTAFTFEISKFIKIGISNTIVVSVSNKMTETNLPYMDAFDWPNDGGITRSVSLHITGSKAIKFVHVTPAINFKDSTGKVTVNVEMYDTRLQQAELGILLKEKKSGKVIYDGKKTAIRNADGLQLEFDNHKVTPWHFDHPFLYELKVTVFDGAAVSDSRQVRFGYRTLAIQGNQIVLNGEAVKLPGIEYMPGGNPLYGAAEPKKYVDSVVKLMKRANVVITRFHWTQDEEWLDLMDEAGILVQEEIPWWQKPVKLTPELRATAKSQLTEMIEAHYNHPSIFAWGINNEVRSTAEDNQELKNHVALLDRSRLVNVIGNHLDTNLEKDPGLMGDLPTWNEYVGTWNKGVREDLPGKLDGIEKVLKGRPLLITEYGLCEPAFTGGDARRADDMFYHIYEWRKHPFIAGFIYFCLNDYRTQMGEEGEGKFKIRRHGVADIYLKPKPSLDIFGQICSPVELTSVVKASETAASISFTVKNTIPSYTLRGYVLEYRTKGGVLKKMTIKDLKPGDQFNYQLKDVNSRYAFEIKRPTGEVVAFY